MATLQERVDLLTAETLALRIILASLVERMDPDQRQHALGMCNELLDAFEADHRATHRGYRVFQEARRIVEETVRVSPTTGEGPQRDQ